MIPDLLDSNTFLLRDYSSFVRNIATKLPSLTTKWTDYSISEPDTIFLNNVGYLDDLTSYVIDFRYLQTSVKYTSSKDFMNSVCLLTGSSAPFYKETYSLVIKSSVNQPVCFLPKNSILYDSTGLYCITTLQDSYITPNTEISIPVVIGNIYTQDLRNSRVCTVQSQEVINQNTLFDLADYTLLNRVFNSSKAIFNFLVNGDDLYWMAEGNDDLLIASPSNEYKAYQFVGFSLEKENVLMDNASIQVPGCLTYAELSKKIQGTKPRDINDIKTAYLNSLSEIYTDINPSNYEYQWKNGNYGDVIKTSLTFFNNRNRLVRDSMVSYTEGYIDLYGELPVCKVSVDYDYYSNNIGTRKLYHKLISTTIDISESGHKTINLELEENCSVKAYSVFLKMLLPSGDILYMTDYNNKIIVPRGDSCYKEFNYLLTNNQDCTQLDFSPGQYVPNIVEIHVSDTFSVASAVYDESSSAGTKVIHVREGLNYSESISIRANNKTKQFPISNEIKPSKVLISYLLMLTQIPLTVYIDHIRYDIPANNLKGFYLPNSIDRGSFKILDGQKQPLYVLSFNEGNRKYFLTLDKERIQLTSVFPNFLFHDRNYLYFIPTQYSKSLMGTALQIRIDNIFSFAYTVTLKDVFYMPNLESIAVVKIPFPRYYIEETYPNENETPREVCIALDGKQYYSTAGFNESAKNFYNSIINTNLTKNTIDLYDMPCTYKQVTAMPVNISAVIYLKPLDTSLAVIENQINQNLQTYFDSLEIQESVRIAGLISSIVHASEYIAYAEIKYPIADIIPSELPNRNKNILFRLGTVALDFRNPTLLQF